MQKLPTWLEIDLDTLTHNLRVLRHWIQPSVKILLTVKADAYGHGAVQVAQAAEAWVDMFGVATVDEALELRQAGIRPAILILSPVLEKEIPRVVNGGFAVTLSTSSFARRLSDHASKRSKCIEFHVEVDTGMGRTGVSLEEAERVISEAAAFPGICLAGLYTHFPVSDTDRDFTRDQVERFLKFANGLRAKGINIPLLHSANSSAIPGVVESHMDMVRPGLLVYGYFPSGGEEARSVRPVMSWKSRLVQIRKVPAGWTISYGRTCTTERETLMGVVPVGYGHGYPFQLSNTGEMLVGGMRVPILGRVTMDMTMVDLTKLPSRPSEGDEVVLIGEQGGAAIPLHDIARWANTIPYEILCGISKRVPRTYLRSGKVETYKSLLGVLPTL